MEGKNHQHCLSINQIDFYPSMKIYILLAISCLLFLPNFGRAQKFNPFGIDSAMSHTKGEVHFESTLEHYFSENLTNWLNDKPISITQFNTTASKYILNRLSLNGNAFLSIIRGERIVDLVGQNANTLGGGISGGMRWEIINFSHHNFYIETYQGMIFTFDDFPPGGTSWNFMVRYGLGYNIHLSNKRYLYFGWRWIHISNGKGLIPENPAYDGNGLFIGFKFVK